MITFVDVTEDSWYYEDFIEAANTKLKDGTPLIEAIPYNVFQPSKPFVLKEVVATTANQKIFAISDDILESDYDKLYIYIDGIQTSVLDKKYIGGNTQVTLYQGQPIGTRVTFLFIGEPKIDSYLKRPVDVVDGYTYPQRMLDKSQFSMDGEVYNFTKKYGYYYESFYKGSLEMCYLDDVRLSRVTIPQNLWKKTADGKKPDDGQNEFLVRKFIGLKPDVYTVSPWGRIYLPYNANGARVGLTYSYIDTNGQLKKTAQSGFFTATAKIPNRNPDGLVLFNNRVFPNAVASRGDAIELISRLREYFYDKLTDSAAPSVKFTEIQEATYLGQKIFNLNNTFEPGGADLKVYDAVTGAIIPQTEYTESPNGHTVIFKNEVPKGKKIKFTTDNLTDYVDVGVVSDFIQMPAGNFIYTDGLPKPHNWSNGVLDMFADETMVRGTEKKVLDGFLSYTNYKTSEQTVLRKGAYDGRTGVRPCILFNPVIAGKPIITSTGSEANPYRDFNSTVSIFEIPQPKEFKVQKYPTFETGEYSFSWEIDYSIATANTDSSTVYFEIWAKRITYSSSDVAGDYELLTRLAPETLGNSGTVSSSFRYFFNGDSSVTWVGAKFKVRAVSQSGHYSPFSSEFEDAIDGGGNPIIIEPAIITTTPPTLPATPYISITQTTDNYIDPVNSNTVVRNKIEWNQHPNSDYYIVFLNDKEYVRVSQPVSAVSNVSFTFSLNCKGKVTVKGYDNTGFLRAESNNINLNLLTSEFKIPNIGDYYLFGKYENSAILWRVINIMDDGNVMLMSDKVLTFKAFSAAGKKFTAKQRAAFGSNYWIHSTLREWLNSSDINVIYSQNKPTTANVAYGYNAYDTEKGFLNEFTQEERAIITPYERSVVVSSANTGLPYELLNSEPHAYNPSLSLSVQNYNNAYQTILSDKVFLPSVKIMKDNVHANLTTLGATYYKAKPTTEAVAQSSYNNSKFDITKFCEYWLETPNGTTEHLVRYINDYGIPQVDNYLVPIPNTPPVTGLPKYFFAETPIYRGELVRVMNWFRLWCIDRFRRYTK